MKILVNPADPVPALSRGLSILESVVAADRELSFTEIAGGLGLPNASVSRLLGVLGRHGYVLRADGKRGGYRPGPRLACLARRVSLAERLREAAAPSLERLRDQTGNTAAVILWTGRDMEWLDKRVHPAAAPMLDIGSVQSDLDGYPWGWLFFLGLAEDVRRKRLREMADARDFRQRIQHAEQELHEHGFVSDHQRVMAHLCRLAAPVRDAGGHLVAALGLAGNPSTLPARRVRGMGCMLAGEARQVGDRLAHGVEDVTTPTRQGVER
jgi:DNA-binding IclR family transcriptional regulator